MQKLQSTHNKFLISDQSSNSLTKMHANVFDMRRLIYSQVISPNKHKACACFSIKTSQTAE